MIPFTKLWGEVILEHKGLHNLKVIDRIFYKYYYDPGAIRPIRSGGAVFFKFKDQRGLHYSSNRLSKSG